MTCKHVKASSAVIITSRPFVSFIRAASSSLHSPVERDQRVACDPLFPSDYFIPNRNDPLPIMAPRIHCVRHAQGFHNLSVVNHAMHDPLLTDLGKEQCKKLSQDFPYMSNVDLVVASPLKRTIYTALLSFPQPIESKHLQVITMSELQETSDLPCDTGSDVAEVEREFRGKPVDMSSLRTEEGATWNSKEGRWAPHAAAIQARARDARQWLSKRPEKDIVVVTHGGFLHYFTEDWHGADRFNGTPLSHSNPASLSPLHSGSDNSHVNHGWLSAG